VLIRKISRRSTRLEGNGISILPLASFPHPSARTIQPSRRKKMMKNLTIITVTLNVIWFFFYGSVPDFNIGAWKIQMGWICTDVTLVYFWVALLTKRWDGSSIWTTDEQ
jgi:hypothetical protein